MEEVLVVYLVDWSLEGEDGIGSGRVLYGVCLQAKIWRAALGGRHAWGASRQWWVDRLSRRPREGRRGALGVAVGGRELMRLRPTPD